HHLPVETIGDVPGACYQELHRALVGLIDVQVAAEEMDIFQAISRSLQQIAVAESRGITLPIAQTQGGFFERPVSEGDAVKLVINQAAHRSSAARLILAEVKWRPSRRRPASDRKIKFRPANIVPAEEGSLYPDHVPAANPGRRAVNVQRVRLAIEHLHSGGIAKHLVHAQASREADVVRNRCLK